MAEVAEYLKANPSLAVGIDASVNPNGNETHNQELVDQRIQAVSQNLMDAGVPAASIRTGAFRNTRAERNGELAIMIRTNR
ncbi:MAG: hypothetical protein LAT83_10240 [Kiritimatiellae bacterium]|nr:hypothetical protein [Kiritimatiellia bacterium]